jgi:hypothetical protein
MIRTIACVCLVVCLANSAPIRSQDSKPNLTGKWVLNMKLSNLDWPPKHNGGSKPRVIKECCETKSAYEIIKDKEPDITNTRSVVELDEDGKERTRETVIKMTTDDNETVDRIDGENEHISAHWNSDRLIINEIHEKSRFPRNIEFRSLSKDGKTMTVELYVGQVEGSPVQTEVFERKEN